MLWDGTTMTDLNSFLDANTRDQGWSLYSASDINDVGQIVGTAVNSITGEYQAFLLTPTAPVPEPETYAMMLAGLGLLGLTARRRKQKLNA
jgi:probable HAF family extracellular repeat protein